MSLIRVWISVGLFMLIYLLSILSIHFPFRWHRQRAVVLGSHSLLWKQEAPKGLQGLLTKSHAQVLTSFRSLTKLLSMHRASIYIRCGISTGCLVRFLARMQRDAQGKRQWTLQVCSRVCYSLMIRRRLRWAWFSIKQLSWACFPLQVSSRLLLFFPL